MSKKIKTRDALHLIDEGINTICGKNTNEMGVRATTKKEEATCFLCKPMQRRNPASAGQFRRV